MITNYRPISILPAVTKITEKLVHSPMMRSPTWNTLKLYRTIIQIFGPWWNPNGPGNTTRSFFCTQVNSRISGSTVMNSWAFRKCIFIFYFFSKLCQCIVAMRLTSECCQIWGLTLYGLHSFTPFAPFTPSLCSGGSGKNKTNNIFHI